MSKMKRKASDGSSVKESKKPRAAVTQVMTRSAKKAALHNAVFLTTELLENVLEQLPMRDLLLAQRVCRKWKAVIEGSEYMQQLLYLKPGKADFYWKCGESDRLPMSHRLVKVEPSYQLRPGELDAVKLHAHGTMNPLTLINDHSQVARWLAPTSWTPLHLVEFVAEFSRDVWRYEKASWRRMLVSQPPLTEAIDGQCLCHDRYCIGCDICLTEMTLPTRQQGLVMGDLASSIATSFGLLEWELRWDSMKLWMALRGGNTMCPPVEAQEYIEKWVSERRVEEAVEEADSTRAAQI